MSKNIYVVEIGNVEIGKSGIPQYVDFKYKGFSTEMYRTEQEAITFIINRAGSPYLLGWNTWKAKDSEAGYRIKVCTLR